jgi:hypothetical protein
MSWERVEPVRGRDGVGGRGIEGVRIGVRGWVRGQIGDVYRH